MSSAAAAKIEPIKGVMEDHTSLPKTEIATMLQREMSRLDLSIDDIRDITQSTYETTRRFVRGMTVPTMQTLKLLSDKFGWDFQELKAMRLRDSERVKHGDLLDVAHGLNPDLQRISMLWSLLTETQRKIVIETVASFAKKK